MFTPNIRTVTLGKIVGGAVLVGWGVVPGRNPAGKIKFDTLKRKS
ncbi:hypothetical protein [uncultured Desulfobacter sp.]|nr:hypothetical protein [uncultured Desulfobacter sp.]